MRLILLVDDDLFNQTVIEDAFEFDDIKAELVCVESGEEAIEEATQSRPDLILMDVHLPGIDGLEATRRLKQNPATFDIPIWAVTADAMRGNDDLAFHAGCSEYVTKPIDIKQLEDKLRSFLAQLAIQKVKHV